MPAAYPSTIPSFTTKIDQTDINWANDINRLQDEVVALAAELGTTPKAGFAHVAERLAHLQTTKSDTTHLHDARYVRRSLATSKGMVIVSTGENDFSALGSETNGQSLISDSDTSTGVRWKTILHSDLPGLGGDDHPHYLNVERHAASSHLGIFESRSIRDLGDVSNDEPNVGDVPKWNGEAYVPLPDDDTKVHAQLSGLDADGHPQYLNESRHNNRPLHDAIGITHSSLTGLTSGHPHTQYPRKASAETVSAEWNFSTRPKIIGSHVVTGPDDTRRIFVRSSSPPSPLAGDVWFRP